LKQPNIGDPLISFRQDIRFARTPSGLRIAYAVSGRGYPFVRAGTWTSCVEHDWRTIQGALFRELGTHYKLHRYDPRGYGLSEGADAEVSLDTLVADLEAIVDDAQLERFALWGSSSSSSPTAIAYAARHPERVSHLVLTAPIARGILRRPGAKPDESERFLAYLKLVEHGWGEDTPAFRQVQSTQMFPGATPAQIAELNELYRIAAPPHHAVRMMKATGEMDVSTLLPRVACPALLLHCREALLIPVEEVRLVASSIPGARFVPLDTNNYTPLEGEPAFERMMEEIRAFLPREREGASEALAGLTRREREVLELVAHGLSNADIAARLEMSEKTVRNTVSHIFDKLAVESRAQAIVLARRAGLGD
jgi:pimeloyl-ACP methyl ester carboxylesterase/DNA-binding CsgD family transcriptional regulator